MVAVAVTGLLGAAAYGSRRASFEVTESGLRLRGDVYGRFLPRSALHLDQVRVVSLLEEPKLRPVRRTFGTGLPGYRAGWFKLAGGAKALLYVTDQTRVVVVPTTQHYMVLLSPLDPDGLVRSLQRLAQRSTSDGAT